MPLKPIVINDTQTGGFVVNYNTTPHISNPFESTMDGSIPYGYSNDAACQAEINAVFGTSQTRFVPGSRNH